MALEGLVIPNDEQEGLKGLRQKVGHGEIEGHAYAIMQNVGTAEVAVEFEDDGVDVRYSVSDMVEDAYEQAIQDEETDD